MTSFSKQSDRDRQIKIQTHTYLDKDMQIGKWIDR